MGEEKLDNTVYTIRGLRTSPTWRPPAATAPPSAGPSATRATSSAASRRPGGSRRARLRRLARRPRQRPALPALLDRRDADGGRAHRRRRPAEPGLARPDRAVARSRCTSSRATATTSACSTRARPAATARRRPTDEKQTFTLNTAIMAVGEGNYGRLGPDQQQRFTTANRRLQLPDPDEQPGAMPEIAPSPLYGRRSTRSSPSARRSCRRGARTARRGRSSTSSSACGRTSAAGASRSCRSRRARPRSRARTSASARGERRRERAPRGRTFTTTVFAHAPVRAADRRDAARGRAGREVRLDGRRVSADERDTNRGLEVTVPASPGAEHTLVVTWR